jgi:hypothetical protein
MRIAIMQPYFMPYLGYFSLIKNTERFILLDAVQFIYHGWIERNRILKPGGGWQYISVPLEKHRRAAVIRDVKIYGGEDWRIKIARQVEHYKKKAPYYKQTLEVIMESLNCATDSITRLNAHCLKTVCGYLGINGRISVFSDMGLEIERPLVADEWALNLCKILAGGGVEYWNPEGGAAFFNTEKYVKAGINIKFIKSRLPAYPQMGNDFEPGLSIVDVMMFNAPPQIRAMLDDYVILQES